MYDYVCCLPKEIDPCGSEKAVEGGGMTPRGGCNSDKIIIILKFEWHLKKKIMNVGMTNIRIPKFRVAPRLCTIYIKKAVTGPWQ